MVTQVSPNLYRIPVPLPGNPLKNLNAYLIRGHRNLLVDTGFRQEECRTALKAGLAELGVDMANTDIFLTHLHSDHAGLAPELLRPTSRLFIGDVDRQRLPGQIPSTDNARWGEFDALMAAQGFPLELLNQLTHTNPARVLAPLPCDRYEGVFDGDTFDYGGYHFQALDTPGHTPGHMVLWEEHHGILLLGDHILFDITPNITAWPGYQNPLGGYLRSLERVRKLPVTLTPAGTSDGAEGLYRTGGRDHDPPPAPVSGGADGAGTGAGAERLPAHRSDDLADPLQGLGRLPRSPKVVRRWRSGGAPGIPDGLGQGAPNVGRTLLAV